MTSLVPLCLGGGNTSRLASPGLVLLVHSEIAEPFLQLIQFLFQSRDKILSESLPGILSQLFEFIYELLDFLLNILIGVPGIP